MRLEWHPQQLSLCFTQIYRWGREEQLLPFKDLAEFESCPLPLSSIATIGSCVQSKCLTKGEWVEREAGAFSRL